MWNVRDTTNKIKHRKCQENDLIIHELPSI